MPVKVLLKSSGLKWELQTLECTDGFHSVFSGPIGRLADGLLALGPTAEVADELLADGSLAAVAEPVDLTAIRHLRFTCGSEGKLKPPVCLHPVTTHLFGIMND